jgi:hypothetical protein
MQTSCREDARLHALHPGGVGGGGAPQDARHAPAIRPNHLLLSKTSLVSTGRLDTAEQDTRRPAGHGGEQDLLSPSISRGHGGAGPAVSLYLAGAQVTRGSRTCSLDTSLRCSTSASLSHSIRRSPHSITLHSRPLSSCTCAQVTGPIGASTGVAKQACASESSHAALVTAEMETRTPSLVTAEMETRIAAHRLHLHQASTTASLLDRVHHRILLSPSPS